MSPDIENAVFLVRLLQRTFKSEKRKDLWDAIQEGYCHKCASVLAIKEQHPNVITIPHMYEQCQCETEAGIKTNPPESLRIEA